MPELLQAKYFLPPNHILVRLLRRLEKVSIAFAHQALTPNAAFKERFVSRSCAPEKIEIVMNSPVARIFHADEASPAREGPGEREFLLMYHGLLVERHGLDLAVRAIAKLRERFPQMKLHLYGEPTAYMAEVLQLAQTLNLQNTVLFHGFKPLDEIAQAIKGIDLGVIPNRLNPFTMINLPTRIFEYLAMKRPVIAPRTQGIRDYFAEDSLIFFEPGDLDDLTRKIEWVCLHPAEARTTLERGFAVYRQHQWEQQEKKLLRILAGLQMKRTNHNFTRGRVG
jgi:glycosyltransferase involved in cell wall biosynthesis